MLSVEEALDAILGQIQPMPAETVQLSEAHRRVLAQDLVAPLDLPPFANSAMDGYAVRADDLAGASEATPRALSVAGIAPAGAIFAGEVHPDTAVRIFTGGAMPAGADAVVPQEDTTRAEEGIVLVRAQATPGQFVRPAGSDLIAGTTILSRGTMLGSSEIAAIAAAGLGMVRVARRPWIAIVTTGDELVEPGKPLEIGQIYNSNAIMLAAAVVEAGGDPLVFPCARDTEDEIAAAFDQAQMADLVLTSGGVSVGERDLVRDMLARKGQIDFWRVNVKPGKPLAFGRIGGKPLLGLPGNPASSAVTFDLFARPAIRALLGCSDVHLPTIIVRLGADVPRADRRHYLRVRLSFEGGQVIALPTGDQGSHRIASLLGAQALAIVSEGEGIVPAGTLVSALMLA
jgi:molybdopterin molybdotransferase